MTWSFAASPLLVVIALIIWGGAAWLSLANWRRRGGRSVVMLESLRLVIVTLLVFTLLRPEIIREIKRTERPEVAVLFDASGSMQTKDIAEAGQISTRDEWQKRQRAAHFWQPLEKDARVILDEFSAPTTGTNAGSAADGTDLSNALETVLQRQKNLKAVLLITDGDWNAGRPPVGAATRFREQGVPVYSIATGRETPLPDLALERVSAPSYGLQGEQISIAFRIRNHLGREVKTHVALFDGDREEARREIIIPASGELQEGIVWSPLRVGENTLTLKLPVEKDEAIADNNAQSVRVNIRAEKLKVLLVESLPRWEYRYLRNALERDPGVAVECVLFQPGMAMGGGRDYLPQFPATREAIAKYDVIFLGDVGLGDNELKDTDLDLIRGLIEQQSSGLVFLPGRRGRQATLLNGPLQDLMPVTFDAAKPDGVPLQNESTLVLSSSGRDHFLTRFDADENRNDEIWKQLPGYFWSASVEKSRPGSDVLAVHSSLRNQWGRVPMLVTRAAGSGKVLFLGTDAAWRWRRGVEDKYHYRFWGQVVRWMAHQRHLSEQEGMRLSYSPENPQVGETLFLQTTVLDANGYPAEEGPVTGRITSPSGRVEQLEFSPVEGGWGVFKSTFKPAAGGTYKVQLAADKHGRKLATEIAVTQPQREKVGQPANRQILRELAGITGGATGGIEDLKRIVDEISVLPEPKPMERRTRLWCDPWWGGLILGLLTIYWTARKLAGMV